MVVTCNRRSFVSEFIHVQSIQDRTAEESWEVKMRRSNLVALLSLLLVASASPSFARATGVNYRGGPKTGIWSCE